MRLGHQRGDPAHVEVAVARAAAAGQALVDIALDGRLPEAAVGGVDGELLRLPRHAQVGVAEHPFAQLRVQREGMRAGAQRQHQHGRRAVDRIPGAHLLGAGLQEVFGGRVDARLGRAQHREDAAHRDVDVDVRRAVQRVEQQQVLAARVLLRQPVRCLHFLGHHAGDVAAPFAGAHEDLVAQHVQRLLFLALHVAGAGAAQHAGQRAEGHLARDGLAGQRHVGDQRVQVAGGAGVPAAFLDEELRQRGSASDEHVSLLAVRGFVASQPRLRSRCSGVGTRHRRASSSCSTAFEA